MSILSKKGSESLFLYFFISNSLHLHSLFSLSKFPQGHGFIAPIKRKSAGYSTLEFTRDMRIFPSCIGSLSASKTFLEKCGSSSKNNIPLWASPTSPILAL